MTYERPPWQPPPADDGPLDVLRAYGQWEADLLNDREAWRDSGGEPADLPRLTEALWDALMALQARRNAILRRRKA